MTSAAHIDLDPDEAGLVDDGLRAALDLHALAVAGLTAGPEARQAALAMLDWLEGDARDENTGEAVSLETALNLTGPGRTHARQRFRQTLRDATLRALWRAHWPDLNPTAAANMIAVLWGRSSARGWPRNRDAKTVPAASPERAFCDLQRHGHKPLAPETIRKILAREAGHFAPMEPTSLTGDDEGERSLIA